MVFDSHHFSRRGTVRLYRKHERGPQISGLVFVVCLAGCFSLLFARNAVKPASDEYEKKIKEKHLALDSIKLELIKGKEKLKQLQQEEGSYVSQLEQLEKNIGISKSYIQRLDVKIDSTARTISDLEASLAAE